MKGTKPDFHNAMQGESAYPLFNEFLARLRHDYREDGVFPGAFGQYMNVEIVGDGPVTLVIDSVKDEKAQKKWEKQQEREANNRAKKEAKKAVLGDRVDGEGDVVEEGKKQEEEKGSQ